MASTSIHLCSQATVGARADLLLVLGDPCTVRLPKLTGEIFLRTANTAAMNGVIPVTPLTGKIALTWDNAVWRGTSREVGGKWEEAVETVALVAHAHQLGAPVNQYGACPHEQAQKMDSGIQVNHADGVQYRSPRYFSWMEGGDIGWATEVIWETGVITERPKVSSSWELGEYQSPSSTFPWIQLLMHARPFDTLVWEVALPGVSKLWHGDFQTAVPRFNSTRLPFVEGLDVFGWGPFYPYEGPVEPPPVDERCYKPEIGVAHLDLFVRLLASRRNLVFSCRRFVPVLRTYIVIDSCTVKRLPGLENILGISIQSLAMNSTWAWMFRATIPNSEVDKVMPDGSGPVTVQVVINGYTWEFIIEGITRSRVFGKDTWDLSGRSKSAYLADPYSIKQAFISVQAINAQQIANSVLPVGWTTEWNITDWLVPGGVWTNYCTPMEALLFVGEAVGSLVMSHQSNQTIIFSPRYKVLPWELNTILPDVSIPLDMATRVSEDWVTRPPYNGVYCTGESQGRLGFVKRTGTAGDVLEQMVTHKLLTADAAIRQRGGTILADAGRKVSVSLELPIKDSIGAVLMRPGMVFEGQEGAVTWTGYVTGVDVSVAFPKVKQLVSVVRYVP